MNRERARIKQQEEQRNINEKTKKKKKRKEQIQNVRGNWREREREREKMCVRKTMRKRVKMAQSFPERKRNTVLPSSGTWPRPVCFHLKFLEQ